MAEKRLIDANELEEKAIYITGPKGSACHAVPLGLIQAAPTIDPETLRPTAHIIRGYVPETKDGVFCDGCNHCLGWEYGAHVIEYYKYCPYCGARLEDGTEEEALCKLKECKRKYDTPFNRETQEVYSNVEEETADVFIMLVYLFAIFNPHELVNITKIVWDKLDRLKDNLDKEAAKQEASDAGKK